MGVWSTSSDYAKDIWLPTFNSQIVNGEGTLLRLFGINPDAPTYSVEGRRWYMKIQVGADKGFGVLRTAGADFPQPGDFDSDEAELELMRFADVIKLDGHESALLESLKAGAADDLMRKKMTEARIRVLREIERMSLMNGDGKLAKVASVSTPNITLDVAGNEYSERNPYTWIDDANLSFYAAVDATTGADEITPGFLITDINESTNVLVTNATTTNIESGDYLVTHYGTSQWTSGGVFSSPEFDGLLAGIDSTNTYMGINRATAGLGFWKAVVDSNSGTNRTFTEALANSITNKLGRRAEDQMLNADDYCGLASPGVWTSYQLNMTGGLRYTVDQANPDIGFGGRDWLPMNGIKLYKHQKAPRNQVLIAHKPTWHYCGAKHDGGGLMKFLDNPAGGIWFQSGAASGAGYADARLAHLVGFIGMYTDRPRNNARLDDITETSSAY